MNSATPIDARLHVLGSVSGYTTLACDPGINAADRDALELLGFGQTDDAEYLSSLNDVPVAFGRALPSGRYAITRCFLGPPDSAGRTTLRFVSLVISAQDWVDRVSIGLWSLLVAPDTWHWMDSSSPTCRQVKATPSRVDPGWRIELIALLSGWLHARITKSVGAMQDQEHARRLVAILPCLVPPSDRINFRWGVGLLAPGPVVDICTLSPLAETSSRRPIVWLPSTRMATAPYAEAIAQIWRAEAAPPNEFISQVSSCISFDTASLGGTSTQNTSTQTSSLRPRPSRRVATAATLLVGLSLAIAVGVLVGRKASVNSAPAARSEQEVGGVSSAQIAPPQPDRPDNESTLDSLEPSSAINTGEPGAAVPTTPPSPKLETPAESESNDAPKNDDEDLGSFGPMKTSSVPAASAGSSESTPNSSPAPIAAESSPPPSREWLVQQLKAILAELKSIERAKIVNPEKEHLVPLERLQDWGMLRHQLQQYNEFDTKTPIVLADYEQGDKKSFDQIRNVSADKAAKDLKAKYKLGESTQPKSQPAEAELLRLETTANLLVSINPGGINTQALKKLVDAIRKKSPN